MNSYVVIALLALIFQALIESSDSAEAVKNDDFCNDFFDPTIRKQLLSMRLADLPIYVKDVQKTTPTDLVNVVIFEKNKLVVIDIWRTKNENPEVDTGRNMYMFKDFVNEAIGTKCFTNLFVPYVLIMCDAATYVFKRQKNGEIKLITNHAISFPGLNIAVSLPYYGQPEQKMRIFQHVPGGGAIYMEKPVNFEGSSLDLGLTTKEMENPQNYQEKHEFRYFMADITSGWQATLSKDPIAEGVKQWPLAAPTVFWREPTINFLWEFSFINLTSLNDKFWYVKLPPDAFKSIDKWPLQNSQPFDEMYPKFCYFSSDNVLYKSDSKIPMEASSEASPEVLANGLETEETNSSSHPMPILLIIILLMTMVIGGLVYEKKFKRKSAGKFDNGMSGNTTSKTRYTKVSVKNVNKATSGSKKISGNKATSGSKSTSGSK